MTLCVCVCVSAPVRASKHCNVRVSCDRVWATLHSDGQPYRALLLRAVVDAVRVQWGNGVGHASGTTSVWHFNRAAGEWEPLLDPFNTDGWLSVTTPRKVASASSGSSAAAAAVADESKPSALENGRLLMTLVRAGNADGVCNLLATAVNGVDVTVRDVYGMCAFDHACAVGNVDLVSVLLETGGVSVCATGKRGWAPVHWAVSRAAPDDPTVMRTLGELPCACVRVCVRMSTYHCPTLVCSEPRWRCERDVGQW